MPLFFSINCSILKEKSIFLLNILKINISDTYIKNRVDLRDILYRINRILFILKGRAMRITRAGEYAVRCVLYMAGREKNRVISRKEVSKEMEIPDQFLGKIAQQLARSGFLEVIQGAKGGYRLLMNPEKITLLDVVEAVSGEIFLNDCIMNPESCARSSFCAVNEVWEKAREQLRTTLRDATFDKLLKEDLCISRSIGA